MPGDEELTMQEGQPLELRCQSTSGRPTPRLVWSRNGAELAHGVDRVRINSSP